MSLIKSAYIEITNSCNGSCAYCYNDSKVSNSNMMDYNDYLKIITKLKNLDVKTISISGGEPLINQNINKILDATYDLNFDMILCTNGTNISYALLDKIIDYNIKLQISLNGSNILLHDSINHINGSFNKIISVFKYLNEKNYTDNLLVKSVITKKNIDDIENIIVLLKKFNINNISFNPLLYSGRNKKIDFLNYEFFLKIIKPLLRKYKELNITYSKISAVCKLLEPHGEIGLAARITPGGIVYPCDLLNEDFEIGNILKSDFTEELINAKVEEIKHRLNNALKESSKCTNCSINGFCKGGCPGIAMYKYNRMVNDGLCSNHLIEFIKNNS